MRLYLNNIKMKRLPIAWLAVCLLLFSSPNCTGPESPGDRLQGLWNNQTDGFVHFGQDGEFGYYQWEEEWASTDLPDVDVTVKTLRKRHGDYYRLPESDPNTPGASRIEVSKSGRWEDVRTMLYSFSDGVLYLHKDYAPTGFNKLYKSFFLKSSEAENRFFDQMANGDAATVKTSADLYVAVIEGNSERVEELLAMGANPMVFDKGGEFGYDWPIDIAATTGNIDMMSALVAAGSPPPSLGDLLVAKKKSPARLAIDKYDHPRVNSDENLALILEQGWMDLAESLLDQGVWRNRGEALVVAAKNGYGTIAERLLHLGGGFPAAFRQAVVEAKMAGNSDLAERIREELDEAEREIESRLGEDYILAEHNEQRTAEGLKPLSWSAQLAQEADELSSCREPGNLDEVNDWSEDKWLQDEFLFVDLANDWSESSTFIEEVMEDLGDRPVRYWLGYDDYRQRVQSPENAYLGCAVDICEGDDYNVVCLYGV